MDNEPSRAADLILRAEEEAGCRFDDPERGFDAMALIAGALGREMGLHHFDPKDDFAAGTVLLHAASPRGQAQREAERAFASLLSAGVDPDSAAVLFGRKD